MLVSYYITTWCHNHEDHDLNLEVTFTVNIQNFRILISR
jgi:hypothetical protein